MGFPGVKRDGMCSLECFTIGDYVCVALDGKTKSNPNPIFRRQAVKEMNFVSFSVLPRKVAICKLFYISKYVHTRSRKCEDGLESQYLLCLKNCLTC